MCPGEQLYFPWAPEVMKGGNTDEGWAGLAVGQTAGLDYYALYVDVHRANRKQKMPGLGG